MSVTTQRVVSATNGPDVTGFYDPRTGSIQYLLVDPATRHCAVIDPVLDFDPKSGCTATRSADQILARIRDDDLKLVWILDTHPHADHFSAADYLRDVTGAPTAIGEHIRGVQALWKRYYNLPENFATDGSQWDRLFSDGESFAVGNTEVSVLLTPGHTLCSVAYVTGPVAFIHDTLFMPDSGSARADFPGGDARRLWQSIQSILRLPAGTRLLTGHDYCPSGRAPRWESTVAEQLAHNAHVRDHDEASYVAFRTSRDRMLPIPTLMLAALQVNTNGGRLPEPEADGRRYLKLPLDAFPAAPWG